MKYFNGHFAYNFEELLVLQALVDLRNAINVARQKENDYAEKNIIQMVFN